jgi:molecular chaperone DnaK (HSP70)
VTGHVFISYSSSDREYVNRLAAHLRAEGVDVWYDRDIRHGDRFDDLIAKNIATSAAVVVVLTPQSSESTWVHDEIAYAQHHDKGLYPVLLLRCVPPISLHLVHFEDVQGGRMPSADYIDVLRARVREAGGVSGAVERRPSRVGIDLGAVATSVSVYDRAALRPVMVGGSDRSGAMPTVARQPARGDPVVGTRAVIHGILHPRSSTVEPFGYVLGRLKQDVELESQSPVVAATIAMPPALDHSRIASAAASVGILEPELLSAHAAGALAVRWDWRHGRHRTLVVQFRSGHAAVCVADTDSDSVEVTSGIADPELGQRQWDERVAEHLMRSTTGSDRWDDTAQRRVIAAAGQARRDLSTSDKAEIVLPLIAAGTHLFTTLDRAQLDALTGDLLVALSEMLRRATSVEPVDRAVLIGDGPPDPSVIRLIRSETGHVPQSPTLTHPIAMAAAWWAAVTAGDTDGPTLTDHTAGGT